MPVRISKGNDLRLYPNPVNGQLTLQISSESVGDETVRIYDAAGRMLKTSTVTLARGMNSKVIDISLLSKGVYFVKLEKSGLIQSITKE